jgi:hypothetical protein
MDRDSNVFSFEAVWALGTNIGLFKQVSDGVQVTRPIANIDTNRVYRKDDLLNQLATYFTQNEGKNIAGTAA